MNSRRIRAASMAAAGSIVACTIVALGSGAASAATCVAANEKHVVDIRAYLTAPTTTPISDAGSDDASHAFPTTEPYTTLGYPLSGGSGASLTDLAGVVDWVVVELRDATDPTKIVATDVVPLKNNGEPQREPSFAVPTGDYLVAIDHRNHLGIMTADPVHVGGSTTPLVDFSDPALAIWDNGFTGAPPNHQRRGTDARPR